MRWDGFPGCVWAHRSRRPYGARSTASRLSDPLSAGDRVALHWDWVCDTITAEQEEAVAYYTGRHLDLVNAFLAGRRSP